MNYNIEVVSFRGSPSIFLKSRQKITTMKLLTATSSLLFALTNSQHLEPNYTSPLGVSYINPSTSYDATGTFSLLSIAGPTLYVAGVRGIHPSNNSLAEVRYPRIRLAFENMAALARGAGSDLVC